MDVSRKEFIEKYRESRPAVSSFAECITRAYLTGVASFALGAAVVHIGQNLLKDKIPYSFKAKLMLTLSSGSIVAYVAGRRLFSDCQAKFLEEEKQRAYYTQTKGELELE